MVRPADGQILSTKSKGSAGAQSIVTLSRQLSLPWRPLVVLLGTQMTTASDQVSVLSVALTRPDAFATAVVRAAPDLSVPFDTTQRPPLVPSASGNVWIVTQSAAPLAPSRLWSMLLD